MRVFDQSRRIEPSRQTRTTQKLRYHSGTREGCWSRGLREDLAGFEGAKDFERSHQDRAEEMGVQL